MKQTLSRPKGQNNYSKPKSNYITMQTLSLISKTLKKLLNIFIKSETNTSIKSQHTKIQKKKKKKPKLSLPNIQNIENVPKKFIN